ncbi:mRNA decay activator protein ZFP36L1-like [Stigmatopora argus]
MPSRFLTPFVEVDRDFCKNFVVPIGSGPRGEGSLLTRIPFRTDRSVSVIEGGVAEVVPLPPPTPRPPISARYKTELCRTFRETGAGACKYGAKCQFAHGPDELRDLSRHPKYKTEPCRTFHSAGFCPYGARCHFIHNAEEGGEDEVMLGVPAARTRARAVLRHSLSFAGFASRPAASSPSPSPSPFQSPSSPSPPPSSLWPGLLLHPTFDEDSDADGALGFSAAPVPPGRPAGLRRFSSADSLSASSCSLSSGAESPGCGGEADVDGDGDGDGEGRRLPIFSRLSVADD